MRSFMVCLLASVAVAACDSTTANSASLVSLEQRQAQWEHRSFHSYSFDYERYGLGLANDHVVVTNDVVTSAVDSTTGEQVQSASVPTIDSLFATARSFARMKHTSVDVDFDSQFGYPTSVSAYTLPANPGGGYQVRISNFQPAQ
jgi:hypothetical protein